MRSGTMIVFYTSVFALPSWKHGPRKTLSKCSWINEPPLALLSWSWLPQQSHLEPSSSSLSKCQPQWSFISSLKVACFFSLWLFLLCSSHCSLCPANTYQYFSSRSGLKHLFLNKAFCAHLSTYPHSGPTMLGPHYNSVSSLLL